MDAMTTAVVPVAPNYIKEFFSKQDKGYDTFFTVGSSDAKIEELLKEIGEHQRETAESQEKLTKEYAKRYSKKYTPIDKKVFVKYTNSRNGHGSYTYSVPDGQAIDVSVLDESTYMIINLETKAGTVFVPCGYCYETASVIAKQFNYNIRQDNTKCNLRMVDEQSYSFLEPDEDYSMYYGKISESIAVTSGKYAIFRLLEGDKFINTLFGISRDFEGACLQTHYRYYHNNKSYETIVKTAPNEIMFQLLGKRLEKNQPIHEILGVGKNIYKEAVAQGLAEDLSRIAWAIAEPKFHKSDADWLELMQMCKKHEKDLNFYGIIFTDNGYYTGGYRCCTNLLDLIANLYINYEEINKNYSMGKFINYIVRQSIDQAYNSIKTYAGELIDYIKMCNEKGIRPSLYTNQLTLTHNIAKRNHKINVTPEDEVKFKERYNGFPPYIKGEYTVIAPTCSDDMKREGDQLDHCVASYIKRVIDGECLVCFLRKKEDITQSVITIEIEGDCIVQARGLHNKFPDKTESEIIDKFAEDRGYKCSYAEIPEDDKKEKEENK